MARRDELFQVEGLIAPVPSPALARLFAVLKGQPRHPVAQRLGYHPVRQYWELHRALYNQPDVIIESLAEHYSEDADCIPLPCEAQALAKAMWRVWDDMAAQGIDVDQEHEPDLPPAPRRWRVIRRNIIDGRPVDDPPEDNSRRMFSRDDDD